MNTNNPNERQDRQREDQNHQPEPQRKPRINPRLVIGNLDFFEMLMEQEEQG